MRKKRKHNHKLTDGNEFDHFQFFLYLSFITKIIFTFLAPSSTSYSSFFSFVSNCYFFPAREMPAILTCFFIEHFCRYVYGAAPIQTLFARFDERMLSQSRKETNALKEKNGTAIPKYYSISRHLLHRRCFDPLYF